MSTHFIFFMLELIFVRIIADGMLKSTIEFGVLKSTNTATNENTNNQMFMVSRCLKAMFFSKRVFI